MLERAKELLQLAELALDHKLYNGCALCCYAALFWAAIHALEHHRFSQPEWSHGGLRQKFTNELIQKRQIYPPRFGSWLSDAYDERTKAHYKPQGAGVKRTRRLVEHVREFVAKVEEVVTG